MIKTYLKTALRNIRRYSTYSALNISGMAIGMASAILILLWVLDEWSYDRKFRYANDLYRVIDKQNYSGGEISQFAISPGLLAAELKKEYPEIIRSARYSTPQFPMQKGNDFIETKIAVVDKEFPAMFDIKFTRGDSNSALNAPFYMVITDKLADKYFRNEDPVGQTLRSGGWLFTITGVVKSLPHNSHLQFDILLPYEFMKQTGAPIDDWNYRCYNYLQLRKGTDSKTFENKISDFIKKNKEGSNSTISLQNLKKIHLYSSKKYAYDVSGHGDIISTGILSLVAVFILIIACINFMNLSTALYVRRTKEVGIRKVNGASRNKILVQFLTESLLVILVSGILAMIMVELLLPRFNTLIDKQLSVNYNSIWLYTGLTSMVLLCGILSTAFPSFYFATLGPIDILSGFAGKKPFKVKFRNSLIILQFSLSVILIICTLIIDKQLRFLERKNLGYNKENIGYFLFDTNPRDPQLETFKKEISNNPDIISVTRAHYNPTNVEGTWSGLKWAGKNEGDDIKFFVLGADEDYAKTFQLEIKEGRFFSHDYSADNASIVINEESAKMMGLKNPVGEIISANNGAKFKIIGVVKDFNFRSLHTRIEPLIMYLESCNTFYIRMKPASVTSTMEFIQKTYKSFKNLNPLYFHFLDEDFSNLYRAEQKTSKILSYFSVLAIIISCLGLIGLSSFMTEQRIKETGIRKINGAKSSEIFSMFSKEYLRWIIISIIIACPIAWYTMNKWLLNFAYHIHINWWIFTLSGIITILIALMTVSIQSYRAANKNPIDALRYE